MEPLEVRLGTRQATYDLFKAHGQLHWTTADGTTSIHQLILAPCILSSKKAEVLMAAIKGRLPISLTEFKQRCQTLSLTLVSDSARSCICVSRAFRGRTQLDAQLNGVVSVWAPCLMHRTALAVFGLLKVFDILTPLFCATVLLHGAGVFEGLATRCRHHVADHLQVSCVITPT